MRNQGSVCRRFWHRVAGGLWAAAALLLVPGSVALAAVAPAEEARRNFDARVEFNKGFTAAPGFAQQQGVEELRRQFPDLGVTYNEETGVTRSILNYVGYLTEPAPAGADPAAIGLQFVRDHLGLFGLSEEDLADFETTDTVYSEVSGATYVYLRQRHAGLPLYNGQLHFGIGKQGRILIVNNAFLPGLASAANAITPRMTAADAVLNAARSVGADGVRPTVQSEAQGAQRVTVLDASGISSEPVTAKLMLLPIRRGDARLVWNFQIYTLDTQHVYDMNVDAVDGRVWTRIDWVASDSYKVYDRPVESPNHTAPPPPADARTTVVNPANLLASPFGWHDTNGAAGAEFTITQGNNVHAYTDTDANNTPDPGSSPDGGATLVFNFPLDLTLAPATYRPAAVTNLFHWNNLMHDVHHRYGFDGPGGNFQVNNYGALGLGNDDVRAEAQDGAGINNANFFTPVDGQRPRMQMFLWNPGVPNRDGDFDAGIIAHEYGHGISNRLVGGPGNVSCLGNAQQPGEGLSDFWALFMTAETGDAGTDGRGIGTYALFQPTTGPGIRTQRYSTDPAINTWTYASVAGSAVPHGVGEKWAEGYWKVYWRLVDNWGFNLDLYNATGSAGNQRANLYIIEGLKATICSPAFTDVRDGVITAATALHSGEDVCRVWAAFAAYGLGIDAVSGGPGSTNPTNGFLLPVACRPAGPSGLVATATQPNRISLTWNSAPAAVTYNIYRAVGACPQPIYLPLATGVVGTTYDDNTVSGGTTYSYVVTLVDGSSIESGFSNCDDAVATGVCALPPTFAGLTSVTNAGTASCALNLAWSAGTSNCGGTVKYNVYRSTTPGFVPGPSNLRQSCVTGTNFSDTAVLSGTPYYYVVRAEDSLTTGTGPCNGGNMESNVVEKSAAAYGPTSSTVTDNVESGGGYWTTGGGTGTNLWNIVTTAAQSPTHSWFVADPPTITDQRLATVAAGNIPAAFTMSWYHRYNTEIGGGTTGFDGYVLEYSLNGTTWVDILAGTGPIPANPARITMNPYNRTISAGFGSPLANRQAWAGDTVGAFQQVQVNLADFSGQNVFFRFRFASDNSVSDEGVWVDDITFRAPGACNAESVAPFALVVDAAGNGVLQPGEASVVVAPTWRNTGGGPIGLTGVGSNFTGPAGPTYTLTDSTAAYGTIASLANGSCATGGDCYAVSVTGSRPAPHWDATLLETVNPTATPKTWTLHLGDSFTDVPPSSIYYRFIETILHKGVTAGCGGASYCPSTSTTREQMAPFVLVAKEGTGYTPPACSPPNIFGDVPDTSPFCRFIEELSNRGVVSGCGGGNYCPTSPVTREQMSVFVLVTLDPTLNPPACVPPNTFNDVPESSPFCRWIEELAARGVVTGCGGGNYCPTAPVTREQMGVFLTVTFGLTLYGP